MSCSKSSLSAPAKGGHKAQRLGPEGIELTPRGKAPRGEFLLQFPFARLRDCPKLTRNCRECGSIEDGSLK